MPKKPDWQRFTNPRRLGSGAFGQTLLVEDQRSGGQQVVIKVPLDEETEEALVHELINNAALQTGLKGVSHPNIVKFLGHGKYEGYHVMIMEYVPGRDLRKIVGPMTVDRHPMDVESALAIYEHMCGGLVAAHTVQLLHRDIKPENVLVRTEDSVAKLVDFGISKILQSTNASMGRTIAGTYPYMSPEALMGRASYEADIWSMSVTLYEMVTGRLPFLADDPFQLKNKIDNLDPVRPSTLNPHVDARIEGIIMRGLDKSAAKRFRTAQELLDALAIEVDRHIAAARALVSEGREDEAEKALRTQIAQRPTAAKLYMALAEIHNRRQQYARSEEVIRQAIAACGQHGALFLYLAPALWNQGGAKRADARRMLEQALQLDLTGPQEKQAQMLLKSWKAVPS